jgi:DNA repair exonuclease SbcCD ATPase subunit
MGLKAGYKQEGKYTALVDLLESQGYLKILMNPTLEVINGKTAKILSSQHVPIQDIYIRGLAGADWMESRKEYVDIVDSLEITPYVFADGYIGLETTITIGSKLTPEGVKQLPIVTKKEITNKKNRIRPGESLIIGGLRKSEKRDVLRGIPFLKDIPVLGILFSGRDFEERAVETIFILTPTFSTAGIPRQEMVEEVERKQDAVSTGSEGFTSPLDILDRKKKQNDKAREAEEARMKAEAEKTEARAAVREAEQQIERAKTEAEKAAISEQQAKAEAEKAIADANIIAEKAAAAEKQAKTDAAQAKTEAAQAKAETAQAKADAQTAAEKTAAAVQQAQTQIEKLKTEAEKLKAETEKAKADLQKATAEAEKAKADAQKAIAEAEKAKAAAEKAKAEAEAKAKQEAAEKKTKEETEQAKSEKPDQESSPKEQG